MERLSAFDLTNLAVEAPDTPMHVGILAVLDGRSLLDADGRLRLAEIRERIRAGLDAAPKLRKKVYRPGPLAGRPLWADDPAFAVEHHVAPVAVDPPGGEEELLRLAERLTRPLLDRSRPLWQLWVVTGLPDRRLAVIVKLHHAVGDGIAAMRLITALLDPPPRPGLAEAPAQPSRAEGSPRAGRAEGAPRAGLAEGSPRAGLAEGSLLAGLADGSPWIPVGPPPWREVVAERFRGRAGGPVRGSAERPPLRRTLRGAWQTLRQGWAAPQTSLNAPIGAGRRLDVYRLDLDEARAVAHAAGGKINDVVLALVGGGLRNVLRSRGEPVDGLELRVAVAVSLRGPDQPAADGNHNGSFVIRLPLHTTDPVERLRAIVAETTRAKRLQTAVAQQHFMVFMARIGLARRLGRTQKIVNLVESNLVGPPAPIRILGAPVLDLVPIGAIAGNLTITFLAISYAGRLVISVLADRDRFPDLGVVLAGVAGDWAALVKSSTSC